MVPARRAEHEDAMVRAFIISQKRQRWLAFLADPKRREDILRTLPHLRDLDERFAVRVPAPQSTSTILGMLRERGAGTTCYILSENPHLDMRTLSLHEAIHAIVGTSTGTLVSCIPGELGYFEGEDAGERLILQRR